MEVILISVIVVMLALLFYSVLWAGFRVSGKAQPAIDYFFDAIHALRDAGSSSRGNNSRPRKP